MKQLLIGFLLAGSSMLACSEASDNEPASQPVAWKCGNESAPSGSFCDCVENNLMDSRRTLSSCERAPCCNAGLLSDDTTRECICYSQEWLTNEQTTCEQEAADTPALIGARTAWSVVPSCPN